MNSHPDFKYCDQTDVWIYQKNVKDLLPYWLNSADVLYYTFDDKEIVWQLVAGSRLGNIHETFWYWEDLEKFLKNNLI